MRAVVTLAMLACAGCATIIDPGPDHIPVTSNPNGAEVLLDGRSLGTTPITVEMDRKSSGVLVVYADGRPPLSHSVPKVGNGWVFLNVLFPGILGILVDAASGDDQKYTESPLLFDLDRQIVQTPESREKEQRKLTTGRKPLNPWADDDW